MYAGVYMYVRINKCKRTLTLHTITFTQVHVYDANSANHLCRAHVNIEGAITILHPTPQSVCQNILPHAWPRGRVAETT